MSAVLWFVKSFTYTILCLYILFDYIMGEVKQKINSKMSPFAKLYVSHKKCLSIRGANDKKEQKVMGIL